MDQQSPKPLFSIIVTNFNYAKFVGGAIDSVKAQDYGAIECIVVDDGSSDESRTIIEAYPDVKQIYKTNGGHSDAARAGFAESKGDVVIFLDADDRLVPHACSTIANLYREDILLYAYKLQKLDTAGRNVGVYPAEDPPRQSLTRFAKRYGYIPVAPTSGSGHSRAHLRRMFDAMLPGHHRYAFDGYVSFAAPFFGEVLYIDEILGTYGVHGDNISSTRTRSEKALKHNVVNALWQCTGVMVGEGKTFRQADDAGTYLSPYHLKNALILRRVYGDKEILRSRSTWRLAQMALSKFWTFPSVSPVRRLLNTGLILALCLLPKKLAAAVVQAR